MSNISNEIIYKLETSKGKEILHSFEDKKNLPKKELAIEIYNYVRDNWTYSPLRLSLIDEDWYAENLIEREKGHCLDKSVILISILKAFDIEARIGLAKVKNHIAAESVIKFMGTDELVPHGYVEIFLDGNWIKATPAFNKSLCDKLGVDVLEFNGEDDSIFQSFGKNGDQFMEYIEDYGTYEELPLDFIEELLLNHYPLLKQFGLKRGAILDMS